MWRTTLFTIIASSALTTLAGDPPGPPYDTILTSFPCSSNVTCPDRSSPNKNVTVEFARWEEPEYFPDSLNLSNRACGNWPDVVPELEVLCIYWSEQKAYWQFKNDEKRCFVLHRWHQAPDCWAGNCYMEDLWVSVECTW